MSDSTIYGHDETPSASRPPAQYKFSQDELRVLQECNTESFFQRSLPLGTSFGLGAFFGVQTGHLKPNPRWGAIPKVTLAVIVGYFLGKLSYQQACAEKLMALPNSYIGQLLREKKEGRSGIAPKRTPTMFGATSQDVYSDAGPGSALDLDTDRPLFSDDHDNFKPNPDGIHPHAPESAPKSTLSYEDLRSKNRREYSDSRQDPYKIEPTTVPPVTRAKPQQQQQPTNKYGDVME